MFQAMRTWTMIAFPTAGMQLFTFSSLTRTNEQTWIEENRLSLFHIFTHTVPSPIPKIISHTRDGETPLRRIPLPQKMSTKTEHFPTTLLQTVLTNQPWDSLHSAEAAESQEYYSAGVLSRPSHDASPDQWSKVLLLRSAPLNTLNTKYLFDPERKVPRSSDIEVITPILLDHSAVVPQKRFTPAHALPPRCSSCRRHRRS